MNKYREQQQAAMGGSNAPQFDRKYYDVKDGQFSFWDGEARQTTKEPIVGIIIGKAFKAEVYDMDAKKFYRTNFYLTNKEVKLFSSDGQLVVHGTMDEVAAWTNSNLGTNPRKKQILWIATMEGVIELRSNITLAIDALRGYRWNELMDYVFEFKPHVYSVKAKDVSNATKERLGKLAAKNPPSYFSMVKKEDLTDTLGDQMNLGAILNVYIKWKDYHKLNHEVETDSYSIYKGEPLTTGADNSRNDLDRAEKDMNYHMAREDMKDKVATAEEGSGDLPF